MNLSCEKLVSKFAFKFNSRHYSEVLDLAKQTPKHLDMEDEDVLDLL